MGPGIHVDPTRTRDIVEELDQEPSRRRSRELPSVDPSPRRRQLAALARAEVHPRRVELERSVQLLRLAVRRADFVERRWMDAEDEKERVVAELTERLRSAETLIVADYRGLTMPQIDALRGKLLEHGARFTVVKNTLTRRAAEAAGADALLALLEGPSAIAFIESDGDMVAVAKALADSARETKVLAIRGGVMQGRTISARRRRGAREAAAARRAARPGARRDRRARSEPARARQRAAAEPRRADRRPHRAARRPGRPTPAPPASRRRRPRRSRGRGRRGAEAAEPEAAESEARGAAAAEAPRRRARDRGRESEQGSESGKHESDQDEEA